MTDKTKLNFYLFICVFLLYFLIMPGKINHKDGLGLFFITQSIVENASLNIPALPYASKKGVDGKFYSPFSIGMPIAAVPFYIAGKIISLPIQNSKTKDLIIKWFYTFFNVICISLMLIVFFNLYYYFYSSYFYSVLAVLSLGISTMFAHYSQTLFSEPFQAFLLLSVFFFYLKSKSSSKLLYLHLSAFLLGYNLFSKTAGCIYYIPFFLYLLFELYKNKNIFEYCGIFAVYIAYLIIFTGINFFYNYYRFGNILDFGGVDMVFISAYHNPLIGIKGFLFDKSKGIFITNPIFILIFFSYSRKFKKNNKIIFAALIFFLTALLFHSFLVYWPGAFCWGPRYILPVFPFIFLLIDYKTIFADKLKKQICIVIIAISIMIQILAVSINSNSFLAFCFNNKFIYKNTYDLPYISQIKGQALLLYQNYLDAADKRPVFILRKSLKGRGEAQIWLFHFFRYFNSQKNIIYISIIFYISIIILWFIILRKILKILINL